MSSPRAIIAAVAGLLSILILKRVLRPAKPPRAAIAAAAAGSSPTEARSPIIPSADKRSKVQVDMAFVRRLRVLWGVCMPSVVCVESAILTVLATLLVLRTRLTLIMAEVVGRNAKSLVERDLPRFVSGVLDIGLWSFPSAVTNSGIRYLTSLLALRFRANLQKDLHEKYLSHHTVYKVCANLHDHSKSLDNPDHRLTEDVNSFCFDVTDVFPSVLKPTIDIVTFVHQLSQYGGYVPPVVMIAYYVVAGAFMRSIMPNFAKLTALTQQREGDFRTIHTQIIQHAEEVAFYRGEAVERDNVNRTMDSLVKHHLHVKKMKSLTDFMDGILIKYGATCVGYAVCSLNVFPLKGKATRAEMARVYIRSSQLYMPLARSIGKIIMLYKRITSLVGYTSRVAELREAFISVRNSAERQTRLEEVARCDAITLEGVDVTTPSGTVLLRDLSLTLRRHEHLLIMGNNGSGKSALMRTLAGMWPLLKGSLVRPPLSELLFVSQRTYLPPGDMRTQLIFPDLADDARRKGISDEEIMALVDDVGLRAVVEREGGLSANKEWNDVLSGGERQRVAMVRVLYHRPVFAFLDECTSATSQDIEPELYLQAKRRGATLVTVSHRESLKQYHDRLLVLDGTGGYTLETIDHTAASRATA